jgi:hypothetical protein
MMIMIAGMMARPAAERREVEDWARDSMTKGQTPRAEAWRVKGKGDGSGSMLAKRPINTH